jgi:cold shock CspA family protein
LPWHPELNLWTGLIRKFLLGHRVSISNLKSHLILYFACRLLGQFGLTGIMSYIEIYQGDKNKHFQNIQEASGFKFEDMLFFDDARDGKFGNCEPVSGMGVLSVHCPNGLHDVGVFTNGLDKYKEWDRSPNHIVEGDGTVTNTATIRTERIFGSIKMVKQDKRFGFIQYRDGNEKDIFFNFNSLPGKRCIVDEGDKVSFQIDRDPKTWKLMATKIALEKEIDENAVQMRCFSMNQPFAALLANGYKTLETRNGTMFTQYAEGTQMLLHVGRRIYPDGDKHIEVMKSGGLNEEEIEELKSLPYGYGSGNAVVIVELGRTYETTVEERSEPDFQRNAAAFGADSGKMVTEIKRVDYLKKPVKLSAQGGVFEVQIDPEVIPDGWLVPNKKPSNELPGSYASISG